MVQQYDRDELRRWLANYIATGGGGPVGSGATPTDTTLPGVNPWRTIGEDYRETPKQRRERASKKVKDEFKKGKGLHELDPETQKIIKSSKKLQAEIEQLKRNPKAKDNRPWWRKTADMLWPDKNPAGIALDLLTRTGSAVGEGFRQGQREIFEARQEDGDFGIEDLDEFLGSIGKGAKAGITGKKKTFFADVIQDFYDIKNAQKHGRGVNNVVRGEGKVPGGKWTKYGLGFAGDVVFDPLTWVTGGVSAAVKAGSKGVAKQLDDVHKIASETVRLDPSKKYDEVAKALGAEIVNVKQLKKKDRKALKPEVAVLADNIAAIQKQNKWKLKPGERSAVVGSVVGRNNNKPVVAKTMLENIGQSTVQAYKARRAQELIAEAVKKGVNPKDPNLLKQIDKTVVKELDNTVKLMDDLSGTPLKAGKKQSYKVREANIAKHVTETAQSILARELDQTISKSVKVGIGKHQMTVLPNALVKGASKANNMTLPVVGKSLRDFEKRWNNVFRASAGVKGSLNQIRLAKAGAAIQHVRAYADDYNRIFHATRGAIPSIQDAFIRGATTGPLQGVSATTRTTGQVVDNPAKFVEDELRELSKFMQDLPPYAVDNWVNITGIRLSDSKFADNFKGGKGSQNPKYNPDWLIDEVRDYYARNLNTKMPIDQLLFRMRVGVEQAAARQAMWETMAHQFGVRVGGGQTQRQLARNLTKSGNWQEVKGIPELKGWVFDKEIAESIKKLHEVFWSPKTTDGFLKLYDQGLRHWKSIVTRYNPGFHVRTLSGEMLLNYLGGVKNPDVYRKAAQVLHGRGDEFFGVGPQTGKRPRGMSRRQMDAYHMMTQAGPGMGTAQMANRFADPTSGRKVITRTKGGLSLTSDQIWHAYLSTGLKSGYLSTELNRKALSKGFQNFTEGVEDFPRLAHFIDEISKSRSKNINDVVNSAAVTVRKFHLDYTNVTGFEKTWMTRAIPFYKWLRLSTPLMAEILMTNPGRVATVPKALNALSGLSGYDPSGGPLNADAIIPEWMAEAGSVAMWSPFAGDDGNTSYFNPQVVFPLAGSLGMLDHENPVAAFVDKTNPMLSAPFSIAHDAQTRGPAPSNDMGAFSTSFFPQANAVRKMVQQPDPEISPLQTLLESLANIGFQENTEKRMKGAAYQEQDKAIAERRALKKRIEGEK